MDRGLKAALSPNEEVTLRRIGYGIAKPGELIARDVEHLSRLALIDRQGDKLVLTELGRRRLEAVRAHADPMATLAMLFKNGQIKERSS